MLGKWDWRICWCANKWVQPRKEERKSPHPPGSVRIGQISVSKSKRKRSLLCELVSLSVHAMSRNIKIATKSPFTRIDTSVLLRNARPKAMKTLSLRTYYFITVVQQKRSLALGSIIFLRNMLNLTYLLLPEQATCQYNCWHHRTPLPEATPLPTGLGLTDSANSSTVLSNIVPTSFMWQFKWKLRYN